MKLFINGKEINERPVKIEFEIDKDKPKPFTGKYKDLIGKKMVHPCRGSIH